LRVFVTDAGAKHSLAAVRALGCENVDVIAGASVRKFALAFLSKYATFRCRYPPLNDETGFVKALKAVSSRYNLSAVLPISFRANYIVSKNIRKLNKDLFAVTPFSRFKIAASKDLTARYCAEYGFPIPRTFIPEKIADLSSIAEEIGFPLVIKSPVESGSVKYANNLKELILAYKSTKSFREGLYDKTSPIIQEYLDGEGYGFFALFNNGDPRAIFCHHRLHEYPITGGPSSKAESFYNKKLISIGISLLKSLNWHGVAMVEFKKSRSTGEFKIIEINPKFWGSLDLAIVSGINFPYLTAKMIVDGDIEKKMTFKRNVTFTWLLFEDILHFLARGDKIKGIAELINDIYNPSSFTDIKLSDPSPLSIQLLYTIYNLLRQVRSTKYPHGIPIRKIASSR